MKFEYFKHLVKKYPYFRSNLFSLLSNNPSFLRRQISEWVRKDWIVELRRGLYTLHDVLEERRVSNELLANVIYSPSYISLESALSHYGMIPERVEIVTSVTSKKTQTFANKFGKFTYHHIKQSCFNHFVADQDAYHFEYFIAIPEKALLDYLYFNTPTIITIERDYFTDALRLQNLTVLDPDKLLKLAKSYKQKKLLRFTKILIDLIQEESHD